MSRSLTPGRRRALVGTAGALAAVIALAGCRG